MENPVKMDDLGVPLFLETPIYGLVWFGLVWLFHEDLYFLEDMH